MKFSIALALLTVTATEAFAPSAFGVRSATLLQSRTDSAALVAEALEMSKKFGASSPEARLAWETVEEVDASDNSAATKGALSADECELDEDALANVACEEYNNKMLQLETLLKAQQPAMNALKEMAASVQQVKLTTPTSAPAKSSPQLIEAMADAKALTEEHGITSSQARVAWDAVEEIAAAGNSNALGGKMTDEECLIDAAVEACQALEELNRVIELQNAE